ncbi:hypothetical protein [Brevundimonas diminuta]|uniref:hypothetical protein n=1 Tax=Brevundimonas diminuta TaxID=293 RepID=UPI0025A639F0|nr:hypothetical protein [Brevundimonas diminuta]MDM8352893.1 hypothetical protein [Brevundimonas diminuta]
MQDFNGPAPEAEAAADAVIDTAAPAVEQTTEQPSQPAAPEAKPEGQQPEHPEGPFWYRKAIEKERKARQALERELSTIRERAPQAQPQTISDPIAYVEHVRVLDRLERSEDSFVDKHGEQTFEEVKDWLTTHPEIEEWAIRQRNPWAAAFQHYQREKLSAEIGDDPNAWREKERERLRAEILAEAAGQGSPPPAMSAPRLPQSAASARSATPPPRNAAGQFASPYRNKF